MTATQMKISNDTLNILKNFSSINSNILIKPGNTLVTLSPMKNVMAKAVVSENFDSQIAIWDLNKFLGTVSLYSDPNFEFNDDHVLISNNDGTSTTKYYYSEPKLITTTEREISMPNSVVSFELTQDALNEIQRAASVLQVPDIAVTSDGNELVLVAMDSKDSTTNTYSVSLGEAPPHDDFCFYYKVENLKMLAGDYKVEISDKLISELTNQKNGLTYWIALEQNSTYNG